MKVIAAAVFGILFAFQAAAETLNVADLEGISPEFRQKIQEVYFATAEPKVLAVSHKGHYAWVGNNNGLMTLERATRVALERCEFAAMSPCFVAAIGNEKADFSHDTLAKVRTLGRVSYRNLPFVIYGLISPSLLVYFDQPLHKALALGGGGVWQAIWGKETAEDAMQAALAGCQKRTAHCVVYEVDGMISPEFGKMFPAELQAQDDLQIDVDDSLANLQEVKNQAFLTRVASFCIVGKGGQSDVLKIGIKIDSDDLTVYEISTNADGWIKFDMAARATRDFIFLDAKSGQIICGWRNWRQTGREFVTVKSIH